MIGHLQQLHEQYADKGLVMLGVNTSDSRTVATAFLARYGVTSPNIVDNSQEASRIFNGEYQTTRNAAPCEYIIIAMARSTGPGTAEAATTVKRQFGNWV